jgi:hypothetical protein
MQKNTLMSQEDYGCLWRRMPAVQIPNACDVYNGWEE